MAGFKGFASNFKPRLERPQPETADEDTGPAVEGTDAGLAGASGAPFAPAGGPGNQDVRRQFPTQLRGEEHQQFLSARVPTHSFMTSTGGLVSATQSPDTSGWGWARFGGRQQNWADPRYYFDPMWRPWNEFEGTYMPRDPFRRIRGG